MKTQNENHQPAVYSFSTNDESMTWAIQKAQITLQYFIECLNDNQQISRYFSAKVKMVDRNITEHIWLEDIEFDTEGNIFGVVCNTAKNLTNVSFGQKIGVQKNAVTDWMIIENGRLIGGYTIRAIRDRITSDKELIQFDNNLGNILIDEGEDHFPANFDTPEGAILCIENAYDSGNIDEILRCKDFTEEAKLILLANGMLKKFNNTSGAKMIESCAEALRLSFISGFQKYGAPSFEGCKRAFPLREKITNEHWLITEVVYHPDGEKTSQKINTYLTQTGWKVLNPE